MKIDDGMLTFAGFLGLAIITAHIINWSIGEPYAFYTYPAMWLITLVVVAIPNGHTAKWSRRTLVGFLAGFLGLAIITAHIINWSIGEPYAFYTYPAMWLLTLVILAVAPPRQHTDTVQVQRKTATTTETATTSKP